MVNTAAKQIVVLVQLFGIKTFSGLRIKFFDSDHFNRFILSLCCNIFSDLTISKFRHNRSASICDLNILQAVIKSSVQEWKNNVKNFKKFLFVKKILLN